MMLNSPLVETAPFAGDRDRELRQLEASRALPLRLAELAPFAGDCDHEEERGLLRSLRLIQIGFLCCKTGVRSAII